ncbi:MAG TPA: hypothetical protein VI197_02250 [Polyangiaceae bacterium]
MDTSKSHRALVAARAAAGLTLLLIASGCVSQSAFEEAQSAAEVERAAHQRAAARLAEVEGSYSGLESDLQRREAALAEQERRLAEADLSLKLAHQERDASGQLVDQLRGELARVGDHLRAYSEQKDRLTEELRVAEGRSRQQGEGTERVARIASVVRDLSLLEGPAIHAGSVLVGSDGHDPVLSAPALALGSGSTLSGDAQRIVKALARLAELHPYARFVISETVLKAEARDPARLRALSEALIGLGVASGRVAVALPEDDSAADTSPPASGDNSSEARVSFLIQVSDDSAAAEPAEAAPEPPEAAPPASASES